jgi:hypothetical protein
MKNKHQVHNLIILDESGSMDSIKETIISGFNEIVQTIKGIEKQFTEQEHYISFVSFNGIGQKLLHFIDPANKLNEINAKTYNPEASTPLYDAMGFGINKLRQVLEGKKNYNVLVTIMTDGEENASREFSVKEIKRIINDLKKEKWTFTYIGTDHNVEDFAESIAINNTMRFEKSEVGMKRMFHDEGVARMAFSRKISMNEDTESDFYENKPKALD